MSETTTVYTHEELKKLLKAMREKYDIPTCDGLPYIPQSMEVVLVAYEAEQKSGTHSVVLNYGQKG